jgi:hypothetical protein
MPAKHASSLLNLAWDDWAGRDLEVNRITGGYSSSPVLDVL